MKCGREPEESWQRVSRRRDSNRQDPEAGGAGVPAKTTWPGGWGALLEENAARTGGQKCRDRSRKGCRPETKVCL